MSDELPVYDVEELSVEEALRLLAKDDTWSLSLENDREACVLA